MPATFPTPRWTFSPFTFLLYFAQLFFLLASFVFVLLFFTDKKMIFPLRPILANFSRFPFSSVSPLNLLFSSLDVEERLWLPILFNKEQEHSIFLYFFFIGRAKKMKKLFGKVQTFNFFLSFFFLQIFIINKFFLLIFFIFYNFQHLWLLKRRKKNQCLNNTLRFLLHLGQALLSIQKRWSSV